MFREAMKEQGKRNDIPNNVREVEAACGNSKAYTCERPKGKRGGDRKSAKQVSKFDNVKLDKPKTGNSRLYIEERLQRGGDRGNQHTGGKHYNVMNGKQATRTPHSHSQTGSGIETVGKGESFKGWR